MAASAAPPPAPPDAPAPAYTPPNFRWLHQLFATVLVPALAAKPLVVHNGLMDLMFILHHFVAPLPHTLAGFTRQVVVRGRLSVLSLHECYHSSSVV